MRQKGAGNIIAVIGPAIAQESYEVSREFYEDFVDDSSSSYKELFLPSTKPGHYLFDLPSFVKINLVEANISVIKHINEDTYVISDKYPSYRRSTHTGEIYNQNILSAIMINK
jgi:polyphenol oxidase